jgi:hypothetical protein
MIPSSKTLLDVADAFLQAENALSETTLSYRIFGDTKKIAQMRGGADLTLTRFNLAMRWFAQNWPASAPVPAALGQYAPPASGEDAA